MESIQFIERALSCCSPKGVEGTTQESTGEAPDMSIESEGAGGIDDRLAELRVPTVPPREVLLNLAPPTTMDPSADEATDSQLILVGARLGDEVAPELVDR